MALLEGEAPVYRAPLVDDISDDEAEPGSAAAMDYESFATAFKEAPKLREALV